MKYIFNEKQMKTLSVLIAGVMCLLTEACTEPQTDMSRLCGEWKSTTGKPDIRIDRDGKNGSGKLSDPAEGRGDVH